MKNFFEEFKKFISRGSVMDLAVGMIIGSAFTAIVSSLVNDIIMPLVGIIIGGVDFSSITIDVGDASLLVGQFIQAIINFLIIAIVLFSIIRAINKAKEKLEKKKEEPAPEEPKDSDEVVLLKSIEKELKKMNKKTK